MHLTFLVLCVYKVYERRTVAVLSQNQSRQSAMPAPETLVPDPRLLHRMRSIYSTQSAPNSSAVHHSEYEEASG